MSFDREVFGGRLRSAIYAKGLNITQAASMLGTPRSRLSEYVTGAFIPPIPRLMEIVEALDLDIRTIFPSEEPARKRRLVSSR